VLNPTSFIYWNGGRLYQTENAGHTWASWIPKVPTSVKGVAADGFANPMHFISAQTIWALALSDGTSVIMVSHDGGRNFTAIPTPSAPLLVNGSG